MIRMIGIWINKNLDMTKFKFIQNIENRFLP